MTRALLFLAATALGTPALAQQGNQSAPTPHAGSATCTPEHAAMGHCTLPAPEPQPATAAPVSDPACPPEHAAMGHCTPSGPATAVEVQPGPPPPEARSGPDHAADAVWGEAAMQRGRNVLREEHGGMSAYKFLIDRAESRIQEGRDQYLLDLQAWYGGDIDKLWLKGELEGPWGKKVEHAEIQALWSHAIDPWFDLQAGARYDPQPGPDRAHLVLGVQGLAPYWWEAEGALFLSNKGELTARAEAEYDLRVTQKLVLQPRVEVDLSTENIPELGIGAGLSEASLGLRLRYQFSPLFAPYVGVEYDHAFGRTRDYRRDEGERADGFSLLAGFRAWF